MVNINIEYFFQISLELANEFCYYWDGGERMSLQTNNKMHKPYLLLKLSKECYQVSTCILSFYILSYVFYITVTPLHPIIKFVCGSHPSIIFGKRNMRLHFFPPERKQREENKHPLSALSLLIINRNALG